ncbi:ead/Ea22-like family protein [Enterobacter hormaechei]|uniref:ead/Ea22-like family protein n=1 Tax=Enterobacter hormaechei TaxID=158836 RepID=UPI000CD0C93A|nr:ead/Ea22-like family protein [Enterobacter hormaechei]PNY63141.1 hypothetical protein C2M14_07225 [Enterobacter cloacae]MCM7201258.1 ead/Ea22-like family protein [Enterobacter hormaechei]MCO7991336.1 ead/Ea22-like family protein [Enterobacter hormaechei]MCO8001344.1 ead/Ea22-like family protein [Enterobacter hormaechei]MCO8014367.1 ead/Ea22-like family protein [Enterobacter hormaechei]
MSHIDKLALREVAEKATPGPWLWINTGSYFSFLVPQSNQDPHNCIIDDGSSWGEYGETINPESPDGVFIAAANPAAVLALLDELEAAEKRIAELEAREVKLPERYEVDMCPTPSPDGEWYSREDILSALVSAGVSYAAAARKGE